MKPTFAKLILLLLLALPAAVFSQGAVIDQVIARIGGEYVLLSELEAMYAQAQSNTNSPVPAEARCEMLDQLLIGKLLFNQSKLDSIEVQESEVESQLNARIDRILGYMGGSIPQFEDYYGQSITSVKEQFREDLRQQLAVDRMRGSIVSSVKVTPKEVKDFFNQIPKDSLPYFNAEVEVGEIAIKPEPNQTTRDSTIARMNDIKRMIDSGELTFEDAAKKYSQDGSRQAGGDLGWTKRGKFVPEFEAAAYNLDPGTMSGVVESQFGYHLIKLQERRGNTIRVSHILLRPQITEEDLERSRSFLDSIATLVQLDSMNFSFAVKRHGYDKVQSYNNDGRMTNPVSGNTFFEIGDLDPDIYFAIDEMQEGDISDVMAYNDPGGDKMMRVVVLQSRSAPHKASLQLDYAKIQDATKQAKQQEHLSDWIEKTINKTFFTVDSRYGGCPSIENWQRDSRQLTTGKRAR